MRPLSSNKCTWEDCVEPSVHDQKDRNGAVWARLCEKHHQLLEESITDMNPKVLLSRWIKAQGGAKKAAGRVLR